MCAPCSVCAITYAVISVTCVHIGFDAILEYLKEVRRAQCSASFFVKILTLVTLHSLNACNSYLSLSDNGTCKFGLDAVTHWLLFSFGDANAFEILYVHLKDLSLIYWLTLSCIVKWQTFRVVRLRCSSVTLHASPAQPLLCRAVFKSDRLRTAANSPESNQTTLTKRVCEIDLKKILKPRVPTWLDLGPELLASFNQSIFIWYQQQQRRYQGSD